ncbi:hypothetical protein BDZ94DRAFT_1208591 [Collybia nuda]|uniref:G-patch domain-containing protein n=1 Tax=Collybia nuda TaxID=64659 RepID=A0A9P6CPZ5_9AGAR|nr:hypothetical protein BDZ94DRAFT_1208591 [Collybia nuda]
MATKSYTIYSHYDPPERETLDHESREFNELDPDFTWESNAYLGSRHQRSPPHFVPATNLLNGWGDESPAKNLSGGNYSETSMGGDLSVWYRSLTIKKEVKPSVGKRSVGSKATNIPQKSSFGTEERRNKNNWFIMKALQSEETLPSSPSFNIADIIERDPPPRPTEKRHIPPVWLEIGPSNKGFEMLQRWGWSEGEPLGSDVVRCPQHLSQGQMIKLSLEGNKVKESEDLIKHEVVELKSNGYEEIYELRVMDVIDLTLSDPDPDDKDFPTLTEDTSKVEKPIAAESVYLIPPVLPFTGGRRTALLTPITTVLKSDRLGIGLKAKTIGPFKASQKRITHNAAALTAHIKAAEEVRKRKQLFGRGRKGFMKRRNEEELERKRLMAYLNS